MSYCVFHIVKELLNNQESIKFTIDEKNKAFINNQFDAPIILAVGHHYEPETNTEHVHRIICHPTRDSMIVFMTCIADILEHMFQNLFKPIFQFHVMGSTVYLRTLSDLDLYEMQVNNGLFTKIIRKDVTRVDSPTWRRTYKPFTEVGETFDLDFTVLERIANEATSGIEVKAK